MKAVSSCITTCSPMGENPSLPVPSNTASGPRFSVSQELCMKYEDLSYAHWSESGLVADPSCEMVEGCRDLTIIVAVPCAETRHPQLLPVSEFAQSSSGEDRTLPSSAWLSRIPHCCRRLDRAHLSRRPHRAPGVPVRAHFQHGGMCSPPPWDPARHLLAEKLE
jgi:hypothetical protein